MTHPNEKCKPEKPQYRCCVCHGGPSDALGIMQYPGRQVMEAAHSSNPWAHRLCIPSFLRNNPRVFRTRPSAVSAN